MYGVNILITVVGEKGMHDESLVQLDTDNANRIDVIVVPSFFRLASLPINIISLIATKKTKVVTMDRKTQCR